jgi:branched-chain amino acid transport system substrate-binding protein
MTDIEPTTGVSRRTVLKAAGVGVAATAGGTLLSACGGLKGAASTGSSGSASDVLKIGYVSPQTGPLASFAAADNFIVKTVQDALAKGFTSGGKKRTIEIVASSTPDVTNPVADQCEANGMPNVSTIAPWEAWYFGRGAKEGQAFKYTTLFFFGMDQFSECFFPMWERINPSNKKVNCLWPNDTDANAFRQGLGASMTKAGWTVVDGGAYQDGISDFSAEISKFKSSGAELFTCTPIPPDFQTFWKQSAQQGFKPKLATVAKVMLFPSEAEALGQLSNNIATDIWWSPFHPYTSVFDGTTAKKLADDFAAQAGKQWTQALGSIYSLFEIAVQAFKNASDPKNKDDVAKQLQTMKLTCMSGNLDFTAGPVPGVAIQHPVGGQWRPGKQFPWDIVIVDNSGNKDVPIGGDLQPTNA